MGTHPGSTFKISQIASSACFLSIMSTEHQNDSTVTLRAVRLASMSVGRHKHFDMEKQPRIRQASNEIVMYFYYIHVHTTLFDLFTWPSNLVE